MLSTVLYIHLISTIYLHQSLIISHNLSRLPSSHPSHSTLKDKYLPGHILIILSPDKSSTVWTKSQSLAGLIFSSLSTHNTHRKDINTSKQQGNNFLEFTQKYIQCNFCWWIYNRTCPGL